MATKGTRGTSIDFGGYEISVSFVKATRSRDPKTEYVRDEEKVEAETGEIKTVPTKTTMSGVSGGGSRTPAPGVYKAVRVSEDHVIRLPEDELEAIVEHSKAEYETMCVLEAIDYRQVPTERIVGSYYLQPRAGTAKGCRMLYEGLRATELCAVVKWVSSSREKLGVLRARVVDGHKVLHLSELSFANDTLPPDGDVSLDDVTIGDAPVAAAKALLDTFRRKRGGTDHLIDTASDSAVDARIALVERLTDEELTDSLAASAEAARV